LNETRSFVRYVISPSSPKWMSCATTGWAALSTWVVVNLVNLVQAVGFASRRRHGMVVNHLLGVVVAVLDVPARWPWWVTPARAATVGT